MVHVLLVVDVCDARKEARERRRKREEKNLKEKGSELLDVLQRISHREKNRELCFRIAKKRNSDRTWSESCCSSVYITKMFAPIFVTVVHFPKATAALFFHKCDSVSH